MNPLILCYSLSFFISLSFVIITVFVFHNKISIFYHLLFTTFAISSLGILQTANADNLQMAVFANQITYLGASFTPLLMLMSFADLCRFRLNRILLLVLIIFSMGIFACTSTVEVSPFYYKNFWITEKYGITLFKKNYGFLHCFYYVYIISTNLIGCFIILKSLTRQHEVSFITSGLLLLSMFLSFLSYMIQKLLKLNVTIVPMSNVISEFFIFILLVRIRLYDIKKVSSDFYAETKTTGLVMFDKAGRYLGSDDTAKYWFPEIRKLKLDQINPEISGKLKSWQSCLNYETTYLESNGRIISAKYFELKKRAGKSICIVYLTDATQQQKYTKLVENYKNELEKEVEKKTEKLFKIQNDILISMANIVESRDNNTGGHIARTSDIVKIFVSHLMEKDRYPQLTEKFAECMIKAAPLHDFGKIAIPDVVLNKPGKFDPEEYEIMKMHSAKGAVIVGKILNNTDDPFFKQIAINVAHFHHEKWDGSGYPKNLMKTYIPFEARIMALADVFDALVSKRVYKESFDFDKAFTIVSESSGTHFDPELCEDFLEYRPLLEELYSTYDR